MREQRKGEGGCGRYGGGGGGGEEERRSGGRGAAGERLDILARYTSLSQPAFAWGAAGCHHFTSTLDMEAIQVVGLCL